MVRRNHLVTFLSNHAELQQNHSPGLGMLLTISVPFILGSYTAVTVSLPLTGGLRRCNNASWIYYTGASLEGNTQLEEMFSPDFVGPVSHGKCCTRKNSHIDCPLGPLSSPLVVMVQAERSASMAVGVRVGFRCHNNSNNKRANHSRLMRWKFSFSCKRTLEAHGTR